MLRTICVALLVLWALGLVTSYYTIGGVIHLLLVMALVIAIIGLMQIRRVI